MLFVKELDGETEAGQLICIEDGHCEQNGALNTEYCVTVRYLPSDSSSGASALF